MHAALLVMALLCSGLISGLFMLRDRLLSWQRGGCNGNRDDGGAAVSISHLHHAFTLGKQTVPVLRILACSCARGAWRCWALPLR